MSCVITAPTCGVVRAKCASKTRATKLGRVPRVTPRSRFVTSQVAPRSFARPSPLSVRCAATEGDDLDDSTADGDDGLSSSFAEELKRRQEGGGSAGGPRDDRTDWVKDTTKGSDRWQSSSSDDAPKFASDDGARGVETPQLKKSRELQNEGLEGFPTRAGELLKLGFNSFIGFGPLIAVFSVLFVGTYVLMGSDFIHGGDTYENGGGVPAYVPPEVLLAEPTVDRMVPLYNPVPYGQ
jgi:hypothetical protein|mmetsp:Transcript_12497/g.46701  ORF Transcript_12497/g.46701 Transcript_12497/m.46701 type:complete len:238 (-) Transcript_12497:60-773(-)